MLINLTQTLIALCYCLPVRSAPHGRLPIVDLGYNIQRATSYNTSTNLYFFQNIRYATAPTGDLRFAGPIAPARNRSFVQEGTYGPQCLQATYSVPNGPNAAGANLTQSEDCLFLDVIVPKDIFERRGRSSGAPVLVWIHGGGFTNGAKNLYNPSGLLARGHNKAMFVAFNYRLGTLGFMSGPSFQSGGGLSNAGLYDQRFALEWIQKYIGHYGGDPRRVTVFGESAGASSILHQITAFGGSQGSPPFSQALIQSPAFKPITGNSMKEAAFEAYLSTLNCTDLACAKRMSEAQVMTANLAAVGHGLSGVKVFGVATDGIIVPDLPGNLLQYNAFSHDINLMTSHTSNEGLSFSVAVPTGTSFEALLSSVYSEMAPSTLSYVSETLYPPPSSGTPYDSDSGRIDLFLSESIVTSNNYGLARAFNNSIYSYVLSIPPGQHGQDVFYTFYDGPNPYVTNSTIAIIMQKYINAFAITGKPEGKGLPMFPKYGSASMVMNMNNLGVSPVVDPAANQRCKWWQDALYY